MDTRICASLTTTMTPELLFRLLCDPTRLRCALLLRAEGSLCVCELTHALEMSQPKISRHLAMLREAGLVVDERRGQWVHYRLHPELPEWACDVIDAAARGEARLDMYARDRERLTTMAGRPSLALCG